MLQLRNYRDEKWKWILEHEIISTRALWCPAKYTNHRAFRINVLIFSLYTVRVAVISDAYLCWLHCTLTNSNYSTKITVTMIKKRERKKWEISVDSADDRDCNYDKPLFPTLCIFIFSRQIFHPSNLSGEKCLIL